MKGACDAHFHVFGPAERYPYRDPNLRYKPPLAPLEEYMAWAKKNGFERFVFVQPSAYGRDNECMLDAMRVVGGACRGIVDIDENAPDAELARLNELGVRGVRINVSPIHPQEAGLAAKLMPRIDRLEARCAELGWMLDFLLPGWLTTEMLPRLSKLKVPFTVAHFGMFLAKDGPSQPGFLSLVRQTPAWVKLTGVYRMSRARGFADAEPMARALIEAAPHRLIWGSDYPHLSFADKTSNDELYGLLKLWARDEATLCRILVENPAKLFGF